MNIALWVLQILLGLHTIMGAVWKFTNSEQAVSSLNAIPHGVWLGMSVVEIVCAIALIIPALYKNLAKYVPAAAAVIALEMLLMCGIHIASGEPDYSPVIYWAVVAVVAGFIAYGRKKLKPLA